jgi:hypothetical protein
MQREKADLLIRLALNEAVLSVNIKTPGVMKLNQKLSYVVQKLIHFTVIN